MSWLERPRGWFSLVLSLALSLVVSGPLWAQEPGGEANRIRGPVYPRVAEYPLPEAVSLCGEPMPLDRPEVRERLDREFTVTVWDRGQVFLWLKRAGRYFPHLEAELAKENLPQDLKYLAVAESSLKPYARSYRGALGTWQFMEHTGRRQGLRKNSEWDDRLSFTRSTQAALDYLKYLRGLFGSWALALAAYNCGEGCLKQEIEEQEVRDYYRLNLPLETERFVYRIAAIKIILEDPERYGYEADPTRIHRPIPVEAVQVELEAPVHLTEAAQAAGLDFKALKELNPHLIGYHLPAGQYKITVPAGQAAGISAFLQRVREEKARQRRAGEYYVVKRGDTLIRIAQRTGVPVATLKRLNNIQGSKILIGQKLRLQAP